MRGTTTSTLLPYTTLFRSREAGAVLEGLELGLGVGVVIGDVRAGVGLGDAEVGEQERDRLGGHGGAPVSMQRQLTGRYLLFGDGLSDQAFGQIGVLAMGDHPARDVAAVDIEDDVEVEVGPLGWPE